MLHFPSTLSSNGSSTFTRRSGSLNATQQKSSSDPFFLKIEEELHDARRVQAHGQEEDLRFAMKMVIDRVTELSSMLTEVYKTQADLEVQLNVAKSNLQLVISNNEMLEDALKRDTNGHSRDVGWRRTRGREGESGDYRTSSDSKPSMDNPPTPDPATNGSPVLSTTTPSPGMSQTTQNNRFFKFRFGDSSSASSRPSSQPGTPSIQASPIPPNLSSPSVPILPLQPNKELEQLNAELEKERAARKTIAKEKETLEAELESLSQALFEEANKMVATERMKLADTEEELKELRLEKEALRSALKLIEGENSHLRGSGEDTPHALPLTEEQTTASPEKSFKSHTPSSSIVGMKSRPGSLDLPLSSSPLSSEVEPESEPHDTELISPRTSSENQRIQTAEHSSSTSGFNSTVVTADHALESSPWSDIPSFEQPSNGIPRAPTVS